jgi:hypothetical protein
MKLFKQRWFALTLCILVVLCSTLISIHAKVSAKTAAITSEFDRSLAPLLSQLCDESDQLSALAKSKSLDASVLSGAVSDLHASLAVRDIPAARAMYGKLDTAFAQTADQLRQSSLSYGDGYLLTACEQTAASLKADIASASAGYNSLVTGFDKGFGRFPSGALIKLSLVSWPQAFA